MPCSKSAYVSCHCVIEWSVRLQRGNPLNPLLAMQVSKLAKMWVVVRDVVIFLKELLRQYRMLGGNCPSAAAVTFVVVDTALRTGANSGPVLLVLSMQVNLHKSGQSVSQACHQVWVDKSGVSLCITCSGAAQHSSCCKILGGAWMCCWQVLSGQGGWDFTAGQQLYPGWEDGASPPVSAATVSVDVGGPLIRAGGPDWANLALGVPGIVFLAYQVEALSKSPSLLKYTVKVACPGQFCITCAAGGQANLYVTCFHAGTSPKRACVCRQWS